VTPLPSSAPQRANPKLTEPRAYLVLVAFVVVSVVVTIAAGYFGFTLGRRLADLEPFEGQTLISIIVVAIVVLIPQFLLQIVQRIAAESDAPLIVRDEPKEEPRDGTP
jgi:hypothetical protein